MGLFSKKLTPTQEAEVQEYATKLYEACKPCIEEVSQMQSDTIVLYRICKRALQEGRDLVEIEPNVDTLIEEARRALQAYSKSVTDAHTKLLALKPPSDWYPKVLRKAPDSLLNTYYGGALFWLKGAIDALQPPEPLKHDPEHGNDKLNVFVTGLNYTAFFITGSWQYELSPIEDWLSRTRQKR